MSMLCLSAIFRMMERLAAETLHIKLKDAQGRANVTGPDFLSGVRDSTGILLILLSDSVSRWHH